MYTSFIVAVLAIAALAMPHKRQYTSDPPVDQQAAIDTHNYYRGLHGVRKMRWDQGAADAARDWVKGCVWPHPDYDTGYGQNVMYSYTDDGIQAAIDLWYNEEPNDTSFYGLLQPPEPPLPAPGDDGSGELSYGHFTAIVWKRTRRVGCYTAFCPVLANSGGVNVYFTACDYYKPGNVYDSYADNVFPPTY